MYKGRYVALIEYDFVFDNHDPHVRPVEHIRDMFRSGDIEKEISSVLCDQVFDPHFGNCKVTQTLFDMHELPEQPKEE